MNKDQLNRECRTFARYLIGQAPDAYVIAKYVECHGEVGRIVESSDRFDRFLTTVAAQGPFRARLADAYASRFLKYGSLRKKMVLTLALLECAPGSFEYLDGVNPGGFRGTIVLLTCQVLRFSCCLLLAIPIFLPVQIGMRLMPNRERANAAAVET
jgi:hypothetical protein